MTKLIVHGWLNARPREFLLDHITELHQELRVPSRTARPQPVLRAAS